MNGLLIVTHLGGKRLYKLCSCLCTLIARISPFTCTILVYEFLKPKHGFRRLTWLYNIDILDKWSRAREALTNVTRFYAVNVLCDKMGKSATPVEYGILFTSFSYLNGLHRYIGQLHMHVAFGHVVQHKAFIFLGIDTFT